MTELQNEIEPPVSKLGCQFSLLGILGAMTFVAFGCGAVLAIARVTETGVLEAFLFAGRVLLFQLPVAVVWVVALILFVNRWNDHPRVSLYGALGVGGSLVIMILYALSTTCLQAVMSQGSSPGSREAFMWIYGGLMFVLALLRATCWGLVIAAALQGVRFGKERLTAG